MHQIDDRLVLDGLQRDGVDLSGLNAYFSFAGRRKLPT